MRKIKNLEREKIEFRIEEQKETDRLFVFMFMNESLLERLQVSIQQLMTTE